MLQPSPDNDLALSTAAAVFVSMVAYPDGDGDKRER